MRCEMTPGFGLHCKMCFVEPPLSPVPEKHPCRGNPSTRFVRQSVCETCGFSPRKPCDEMNVIVGKSSDIPIPSTMCRTVRRMAAFCSPISRIYLPRPMNRPRGWMAGQQLQDQVLHIIISFAGRDKNASLDGMTMAAIRCAQSSWTFLTNWRQEATMSQVSLCRGASQQHRQRALPHGDPHHRHKRQTLPRQVSLQECQPSRSMYRIEIWSECP